MNNYLALEPHKDNNINMGANMDKRRDPRISLALSVTVKKDGEKYELTTVNISRGGAFIKTDKPLSIGELFDISIDLIDKKIECRGKVIWVNFPNEKSEYLSGMGVKFIDMDIQDVEYLGKFLGEELKKKIIVDEARDYPLKERIQIFDSNILEINSDCLVLFACEDGEFLDSFSKNIFDKANGSTKRFYEMNKYSLSSKGAFLLPYICDEYAIHYILIVAVPTYFDSYGEELLRKAILNCLDKTSEQVFNSVSIPVFTLFETSFPINVISKILVGTIYGFLKKEYFPRKVFLFTTQNDENIRLKFENKIEEIFS